VSSERSFESRGSVHEGLKRGWDGVGRVGGLLILGCELSDSLSINGGMVLSLGRGLGKMEFPPRGTTISLRGSRGGIVRLGSV